MKGFKGFNKDLKCRDIKYTVGKTQEHEGPVELCNNGLHFCEYPLDIFGFIPRANPGMQKSTPMAYRIRLKLKTRSVFAPRSR